MVDDDPYVRDVMKQLLEHCGHEVEEAENGAAALAQLARQEFDVVITDFSMPGMHGDQLVTRIRERLPQQRIIMVSGFADEYLVFGQPSAHVDALLLKPFSLPELQEAMDRVWPEVEAPEAPTLPPLPEPSRENPGAPPPNA